jgi:hypothetical protein
MKTFERIMSLFMSLLVGGFGLMGFTMGYYDRFDKAQYFIVAAIFIMLMKWEIKRNQ